MSTDNGRAIVYPAVRIVGGAGKSSVTKKEQSRLSQFAYRQRQKALAKANQQELASLAAAARAAQAQAADALAEIIHLKTQASTLKGSLAESDRLANVEGDPYLTAAANNAGQMEHLQEADNAQLRAMHDLTAAAMSESVTLREEVEHLKALLQTEQQQQQQHFMGEEHSLNSGSACAMCFKKQAVSTLAQNQEAGIVAAFEALMSKLQLLRPPPGPLAMQEVEGAEQLATTRLLAIQDFVSQLQSDMLLPLQSDQVESKTCSGSLDTTDYEPIISVVVPQPRMLFQGAEELRDPQHSRWRTVCASPFATASSPPSGWAVPGAWRATATALPESVSNPLITLWSVASRCESHLLTDDIYGSFHE